MRITPVAACITLNNLNRINLTPKNILNPEKGRLLISEPFLEDPYFKRAVILLCEHDHEGSYGFILNKYVDLTLPEILDGMPMIDNRISVGGPVESSNLYYIHTMGALIDGSLEIADGIYVGGDFEQVESLIRTGVLGEKQIRFFVGYSGWSADQLDAELTEHAWYVCDAQNIPIMDTARDDIWGLALREMGGDFANLAHFPSDPNLN